MLRSSRTTRLGLLASLPWLGSPSSQMLFPPFSTTSQEGDYQDLQIRNLVRNRHLAKSIHDAGWGQFLAWVKYYGMIHSIPVIVVAPQFTSQACSACGAMVKKSLSVRTHICPRCGVVLDRDQNAALNILAFA